MRFRPLHNPGVPVPLALGGMEFLAFSISGLATYVLAPGFDACFDLGHCALEASHLRNVFLSHTHQDHAGGVHRHLSLRAMTGARPSRIYCPVESADALTEHLRAWCRLEGKDPAELDGVVTGLAPGARVEVGKRYRVDVFDVAHRLPSRGYTLVEHRRALRPEWVGRSGPEIGAAVASGEEVHVVRDHRRFTYVGDSTIETFARTPGLADCDVLFVEATHLPGGAVESAHRYGHTHLDELAALWSRDPAALGARHIVVKHFSLKYREEDIAAALASLPEGLRERVTMLA